MHDRIELRTWHQRHADLLREAKVRRLSKASQAPGQAHIHRIAALKRELHGTSVGPPDSSSVLAGSGVS